MGTDSVTLKPRRIATVLLAVVALGAAYFMLNAWAPEEPTRYPEFDSVPEADLARARASLPKPTRGFGDLSEGAGDRVRRNLAGCTPWAVVAALVERAEKATGSMSYGRTLDDDERKPVGTWLAEQADDSLNPVLLRIAADEEMEFPLRDTALVAVCRPENVEALAGLVRIAMDMEADDVVRDRVLSRLHRIGVPPGGDFETLLHLPFRDHDYYAAAVLAITDRPIAPSLILEGLEAHQWDEGLRRLLVLAAAALAREDGEIAARARLALSAVESEWGFPREGEPRLSAVKAIADLASSVRRWLAEHPEALETSFEREWAEYRDSDAYRRARRVLAPEDPRSLPDEGFDFAAALLRILDEDSKWRDRPLDALDRMALLFRREMAGVASPKARLEVLHRRLLVRHQRISSFIETGPSSFLNRVLRERAGNCVGLTSLYVALGERLDLPLVAVELPNHVFLRWDDGAHSFDVELTDRGRIRTVEDLEGKRPRVLTKKGLVSVVLSNRANVWLESPMIKNEGRLESALELAERAIAWDPENEAGHLARARCLTRMGEIDRALAAAEAATRLSPDDVNPLLVTAESLLLAGRPEDAIQWFDRAFRLEPANETALQGRLVCLERMGRYDEIIEEATEFLSDATAPDIRRLRLLAMVRMARGGWSKELGLMARVPPDSWHLRMTVAELLLERDAGMPALKVLDGLSDLEREVGEAKSSKDSFTVVVEVSEDYRVLMRASEIRELWRKAQGLRLEAYEKSGQAEKAKALRRSLGD